jgi:hypothetical protein
MTGGFDLALELEKIYDSEINISIGWFWDGGITVRLGDEIGGYIAEEAVESVAGVIPWLQEAIAHFYPTSSYARGLSADIGVRAARRVFTPPRVNGAMRSALACTKTIHSLPLALRAFAPLQ